LKRSFFAAILALFLLAGCAGPATVRVMSYNIHHGEGMDGKVDLTRIAAVINAARPDLVALQEVDRGVERTGRIDEPGQLAELTGLKPVFEKNIIYQGGEYGNAVLSRLPVQSCRNHKLPQSIPTEQRGLLEVHVAVAGREFIFCATHLDYHPAEGERLASADFFRSLSTPWSETPYVIAGDFNAGPDSTVLRRFYETLLDSCPTDLNAYTFSSTKPDRRIDYILYSRNPQMRCVSHEVIDEPMASDHRPILAVFQVRR